MSSPVAAICGENASSRALGFAPDRVGGCGQEIATCAEVYRCVDCDVPFHRSCARHHFAMSASAEKDRLIEKREDRIIELLDRVAELEGRNR